jgi:hypothetical protein
MQVSGYTVVADKINFMRFTTHFRSVHRGQFFAEMKTTTVRKLLPENWGFLCPVHTPDGGPCGLLNHLAGPATVTAYPLAEAGFRDAVAKRTGAAGGEDGAAAASLPASPAAALTELLVALGMVPFSATHTVMPASYLPIMLDGCPLGGAAPHVAYQISRALRRAKALTAAVRAGIDRVGAGKLPGQDAAVQALLRAAVVGQTLPTAVGRRGKAAKGATHSSSSSGGGASGGAAVADYDDLVGAAGAASGPVDMRRLLVVPPALEVAFLPPPWWEPETDAAITDAAAGARREAAVAVASGAAAAGAAGSDARGESGGSSDGGGAAGDAPATRLVGLYPGLFLSTAAARLVRPVIQLDTGLVELISPLEQPYMDIACTPEDVTDILHADHEAHAAAGAAPHAHALLYTHIELSPLSMLSEAAALTPFSDMNQSPRNMYQCQMGKQTMGTPVHSWVHRTDTKLFRLQTPQAPLVQNAAQG